VAVVEYSKRFFSLIAGRDKEYTKYDMCGLFYSFLSELNTVLISFKALKCTFD
jgi:hypothetical protein